MSKVVRLPRSMYDPTKKSRNLIGTISTILPLAITVLLAIGVLNLGPEDAEQFKILAMNAWESIVALIGIVKMIIDLFKTEDVSKIRTKYLKKGGKKAA